MFEFEMFSQGVVLFLTLFAMMIGLIFTLLPPVPGTIIIWAAALVYGLVLGWEKLGWLTFGILTFLMILGAIADFLGGQVGAKLGGASCLAVAVGTVFGLFFGIGGSVIGTPIVGCLAGVAGTLGGILLVERIRFGDWGNAAQAIRGYVAGNALGIAAKVTAGILMFGVFIARVYLWG